MTYDLIFAILFTFIIGALCGWVLGLQKPKNILKSAPVSDLIKSKEVFASDLAAQKPTLETLHRHVVYLRDGLKMIEAQMQYFKVRVDALEKEILTMRGIHV